MKSETRERAIKSANNCKIRPMEISSKRAVGRFRDVVQLQAEVRTKLKKLPYMRINLPA